MKMLRNVILFVILVFVSIAAKAQAMSENQKKQMLFIQSTLMVDSVTALKAFNIQDHYKAALKIVEKKAITDSAKREIIKSLVIKRNKELRTLLPESKAEKLIPSTERTVQ